jgi:hypothetical protein
MAFYDSPTEPQTPLVSGSDNGLKVKYTYTYRRYYRPIPFRRTGRNNRM